MVTIILAAAVGDGIFRCTANMGKSIVKNGPVRMIVREIVNSGTSSKYGSHQVSKNEEERQWMYDVVAVVV